MMSVRCLRSVASLATACSLRSRISTRLGMLRRWSKSWLTRARALRSCLPSVPWCFIPVDVDDGVLAQPPSLIAWLVTLAAAIGDASVPFVEGDRVFHDREGLTDRHPRLHFAHRCQQAPGCASQTSFPSATTVRLLQDRWHPSHEP